MATIVTRSGKGSPLTHAEVDSNFTNLNTDKLELSGGTMTGNLSFGDNDKAIFGAGSDLQIYHDGSASYIDDQGEGPLKIKATDFRIKNAADTKNYLRADDGGAVSVYYDNAQKLATTSTGVDITGTLTSDGLTVDGVGNINGSSSAYLNLTAYSGTQDAVAQIQAARGSVSGTDSRLKFLTNNGTSTLTRIDIDDNGDISFYEDTGTTAKFFWDASAESLGIGTSSPSSKLHINTGSYGEALRFQASSETSGYYTIGMATGAGLAFSRDGSERMRIDSSGNLLVGTTTLSTITDGHELRADGKLVSSTSGAAVAYFNRNTDDGDIIRLDKSGTTVGSIGAKSGALYIGGALGNDAYLFMGNDVIKAATSTGGGRDSAISLGDQYTRFTDLFLSGGLRGDTTFKNNAGTTEYARFDSSGNLLVGHTQTPSEIITGSTYEGLAYKRGDYFVVARSSAPPISANRLTDDGDIMQFRKDGSTVGSIGTATNGTLTFGDLSTNLTVAIGANDTSLKINGSVDAIYPGHAQTGDNRDALVDIGRSTVRFKDLYLSGGVFLGGTGSSNKLDDYEEGTFTANYSATGLTVTHDITTGKYTKVGNLVTFYILLGTDAVSGVGAVQLSITGLPFAPASAGLGSGGAGLAYSFVANENNVKWTISSGGTLNLWDGDSNTAGVFPSNKLATGANKNRLNIIGHYYAA